MQFREGRNGAYRVNRDPKFKSFYLCDKNSKNVIYKMIRTTAQPLQGPWNSIRI